MRFLTSQGGFTVIEMMTVLTVIGVLSALLVVSTQVSNRRQELRDAASGFVTAAANAESLASSAQSVADPDQGDQPVSRKAYGVCITSSQIEDAKCDDPVAAAKPADMYQVYARDPDETEPVVEDTLDVRPDRPEIVSSYRLPKDYTFTNPNVWIDYVPPRPDMFRNGGSTNATLVVRYRNVFCIGATAKDCQRIQIKPRAGAVYVQ